MVADCSVLCYCNSSNGNVFIVICSGPIPPVRTHRSLKTPAVDETSVSGCVYHLLLGHEGGRRGHQVSAPQALHRPGPARPPPTPADPSGRPLLAGPVVRLKEAAQADQPLCEGLVVLGVHHPQGSPARAPCRTASRQGGRFMIPGSA
ncbi:unnamed protein product [Arctogadus glacialis]